MADDRQSSKVNFVVAIACSLWHLARSKDTERLYEYKSSSILSSPQVRFLHETSASQKREKDEGENKEDIPPRPSCGDSGGFGSFWAFFLTRPLVESFGEVDGLRKSRSGLAGRFRCGTNDTRWEDEGKSQEKGRGRSRR